MAKLAVNLPNMAPGALIEVPPHGAFENGRVYTVAALESDLLVGVPFEKGSAPKAAKDPNETYEPVEQTMHGSSATEVDLTQQPDDHNDLPAGDGEEQTQSNDDDNDNNEEGN